MNVRKQATFTLDSGLENSKMVRELKFGRKTAQLMSGNGATTCLTVMESSSSKTVTSTKETGTKAELTATAPTSNSQKTAKWA